MSTKHQSCHVGGYYVHCSRYSLIVVVMICIIAAITVVKHVSKIDNA